MSDLTDFILALVEALEYAQSRVKDKELALFLERIASALFMYVDEDWPIEKITETIRKILEEYEQRQRKTE